MTKKLFPSTADANITSNDSPMSARSIKEILSSLDIQSMNTDILQIPSEQNQFHAVAKHTVTFKSGESYSAIGSALPNDKVSSLETLDKAQDIAFQNAFHLAHQARRKMGNYGQQIDSLQPAQTRISPSNPARTDSMDKAKMNGGGNKPISEKQLNLIKTRASQKDTDADSLARNKFGKSLAKLSGSEAHEIIGLLNDSVY